MSSENVAGIDPGKTGGFGILDLNGELLLTGPIDFEDPGALYDTLAHYKVKEILIERAQAAKGDAGQFEYGRSFGRIEAACMMTGAKVFYCGPAWWKSRLNVSTDKTKAYWHAVRVWPRLEYMAPPGKCGGLQKVHGAAEACFIGSVLTYEKLYAEVVKNNDSRVKRAAAKKSRPKFNWAGD